MLANCSSLEGRRQTKTALNFLGKPDQVCKRGETLACPSMIFSLAAPPGANPACSLYPTFSMYKVEKTKTVNANSLLSWTFRLLGLRGLVSLWLPWLFRDKHGEIHHAKGLPLVRHLRCPPLSFVLSWGPIYFILARHLTCLVYFSVVFLQSKVLEGQGLCLPHLWIQPSTWYRVGSL